MEKIILKVREELRKNIDSKTLETGQHFFKEKIDFYGVTIPKVNKIADQLFKEIMNEPKPRILEYCEQLFQSENLEESFVASDWSYQLANQYTKDDFLIFQKWINEYINNWASCDTLCNHTVGTLVEQFPELIDDLIHFTDADNRWVKRAAAVTLIIPARKGLFLEHIFKIADILLLDPDDLVQKGYGWMLKAASQAHQEEVFQYVIEKKAIMPRTSLRYAIEKMPTELKKLAMEK
ncbi:MAG: putative alkylation repair enzyme [Bacteroidetes bacterium]|nr:putative alkylation repair enzyme [Bacteroidota bacterium]